MPTAGAHNSALRPRTRMPSPTASQLRLLLSEGRELQYIPKAVVVVVVVVAFMVVVLLVPDGGAATTLVQIRGPAESLLLHRERFASL